MNISTPFKVIDTQNAAKIKGGTNFCEWYISVCGDGQVPAGQMKKFMELDAILATDGYAAACASNPKLLAKYGFTGF